MHRHGHTDAARRCRYRETGYSPSGGAASGGPGAGRRRAVRPLTVEYCIPTTVFPLHPDNRAASSETCDPSIGEHAENAPGHDSTIRIIFHKQAKNRPDTTIDKTPQILLYICIHRIFLHHCTLLYIVFLIYVTLVFTVSLYRT
nr:MAG TPA: hypothetical protein [Caudoviricetes sp.]